MGRAFRPWPHPNLARKYLGECFSTTKGIVAICMLQLIEKGLLDIDKPVSDYWPEFAQNGKENIPVRYFFVTNLDCAASENL